MNVFLLFCAIVDSQSEEYQKKDRTCLVIAAIIMTIMIIAIVVVARAKTA